ncbi:hypothetical protein TIFTF001_046266 [Ficus carica]|uniref:Uncharacterized protein n=1 Tax=Ficus carica TaxID=3494 RepID=A0AA87Z9M0_FICCA|nr:hypothetical protein TIFTF001_046266 [Ficus carica]
MNPGRRPYRRKRVGSFPFVVKHEFGNAHSVHLLVNLCMSFWAMSRLPSLVEINCLYWN